jgi:hypothetical protein
MTAINLSTFAPVSLDKALELVLDTARNEQTFADASRGALKAAIAFLNVPQCEKDATVSAEDEQRLSPIFDEYMTGRLMGGCGIEESAARLQLSLQPYFFAAPEKNSDKNRTERAQRVLNSARVTLSRIRAAFNIPAMKTSRKPRPEGNATHAKPEDLAHGSSLPTSIASATVPHVKTIGDANDWLKDLDVKVNDFERVNAKVIIGDAGEVLRETFAAFHAGIAKARAIMSDPRAAQIAALQAQLAKLMTA